MSRVRGALLVALLLAVVPVVARADDAPTKDAGSLLAAVAEAYALRVEYDLPVPAGTGTVAHVTASASRSGSGELAHGLAAAPTAFEPVVGGKYADPQSTGHPVNKVPNAECNYPSDKPSNVFRFPTDTNADTAGVAATSFAAATCGAGPSVDLRARDVDPSDPTMATASSAEGVASEASIRPDRGVLSAGAFSHAQGVSLAGGQIRIGSITATGGSKTSGTPGSAATVATVEINDIEIAGVRFSLAFTGSGAGESVTGTVAGTPVPIAAAAAQEVIDAANVALKATGGCELTVVSDPSRYPQGFLFGRPEPQLGVHGDGSLAASFRGGLLVLCDVPDNPVAQATKFSPERFQALVGFVFTSVAATDDVGGFGIGDLASAPLGGLLPLVGLTPATPSALHPPMPAFAAPGPASIALPNATDVASPGSGPSTSTFTSLLPPLSPSTRWIVAALCLLVWAALTHLGLTRLLTIGGVRDD